MITFWKNLKRNLVNQIRGFVDTRIDHVGFLIFKILIFLDKKSFIVVCDIDNTIADTWPHLSKNEVDYSLINFIDKNVRLVQDLQSKGAMLIFLTARNHNSYFETKNWLKKRFDTFKLFTLSNVSKKNLFIGHKRINKKNNFYIDDLSYNHENGKVLFYENLISQAKKSNFTYIGYEELKNHEHF